jgi:chromosome partitioning protein
MRKIAIGLQKGGVGKTITSLCLAGALTIMNRKVLLIDMDPQANSSTSLGVDDADTEMPSVHDLLVNPSVKASSIILQTGYGIDLIPATITMAVTEKHLASATSHKKLANKLDELKRQARTNPELNYDYIILDCPPSLGALTLNALAAADRVIAPVDCGHFAAQKGLRDFVVTMEEIRQELNPSLQLFGVLLTHYGSQKVAREVATYVKEQGYPVFDTKISKRTILGEVPVKGPIQAYAPSSEAAQEYAALAQEVENHDWQ